jgi:hypothetical protein
MLLPRGLCLIVLKPAHHPQFERATTTGTNASMRRTATALTWVRLNPFYISGKTLGRSRRSEGWQRAIPACMRQALQECVMTIESTNAAYGVYTEDVPVTDVVHALNDAGFDNEDICLMLARSHPISMIVREASFRNADREASAVAAGLIEWLSEFGAVVIRTFGFFIRSQMFLHALVTTREAPDLCGNSEMLMDLGFSEEDAGRLEDQLCEAGVLVYVACSEAAQATWAEEMFQRIGARESAALNPRQESDTAA